VACRPGTGTRCDAVGYAFAGSYSGRVETITNNQARAVRDVPGAGQLAGIACPRSSHCVAVGDDGAGAGVVVPTIAGIPGATAPVAGASQLSGIACPRVTICYAVGTYQGTGIIVTIADGHPAAAQPVAGTIQLNAVACPNATRCLAAGTAPFGGGIVVPITNGIPGAAQPITGTFQLFGADCPDVTRCTVVGMNAQSVGTVVTITTGDTGDVAGAAQPVPGTFQPSAVACRHRSGPGPSDSCVAVGTDDTHTLGKAVTITDGIADGALAIPGTAQLLGVDCAPAGDATDPATTCVAVGQNPNSLGVIAAITTAEPGRP
jgi:hypothetical protein